MRRFLPFALLAACLTASACRAFPGHPVRLSQPRLIGAVASSQPGPGEPGEVADDDAAGILFAGLEGLLVPLRTLQKQPHARTPRVMRLRRMESAVSKRYRRGGFGGRVKSVVVLGAVGTMPFPPAAAADLICDPGVQRAALAAEGLRKLETVYELPGVKRERFRADLLHRGAGPIRYDLRFSLAMERRVTRDGRVFLRYDPDVRPKPEHVTLFRGGCLLEPEGTGTRVTEILIIGTDIQLLPFLQGEFTKLVLKTMGDRVKHVWSRAWQGR